MLTTGVYAWLTYQGNQTTRRSAKAAEQSAKSSEHAAVAAQRSLRLAAMPLVVGYDFHRLSKPWVQVDVRNEGPMTAFNLGIKVTYPSIGDDLLAADLTLPPVSLASLSSGDGDSVQWSGDIVIADGPYFVTVEFDDPLGNRYQTVRHSLPGGNSSILVSLWNPVSEEWDTMVDVEPM